MVGLRAGVFVREEAVVGLRAGVLVREEAVVVLRAAVLVREEVEAVDVLFFFAVLFLVGMEPPLSIRTRHEDDRILYPASGISYRRCFANSSRAHNQVIVSRFFSLQPRAGRNDDHHQLALPVSSRIPKLDGGISDRFAQKLFRGSSGCFPSAFLAYTNFLA